MRPLRLDSPSLPAPKHLSRLLLGSGSCVPLRRLAASIKGYKGTRQTLFARVDTFHGASGAVRPPFFPRYLAWSQSFSTGYTTLCPFHGALHRELCRAGITVVCLAMEDEEDRRMGRGRGRAPA